VTVTAAALEARGVGGFLDELADCVAEHFGVQHATFQVEPESHRQHEDLGEPH
jgi:cobalt-zinc-cadmium efflux system protein